MPTCCLVGDVMWQAALNAAKAQELRSDTEKGRATLGTGSSIRLPCNPLNA